jgi:hypothetical protein
MSRVSPPKMALWKPTRVFTIKKASRGVGEGSHFGEANPEDPAQPDSEYQ